MSRCSDDEAVAAEALSKGRVKKALLVVPTLRRMFSMEEPLLRGVSRPHVDGELEGWSAEHVGFLTES